MRRVAAFCVLAVMLGASPGEAGAPRSLAFGRDSAAPFWSSDGSLVAFPRFELSGNRLSVFDAISGTERPVSVDMSYFRSIPAPVGNRIAFQFTDRADVVSLDDGSVVRISPTPYGLSWAPDGTRLVYPEFVRGTLDDFRIIVFDVRTGDRRDLGPGSLADWSPDGREIAVVRRTGDRSTAYAVRLDGSGERVLGSATTGLSSVYALEWSPDGQSLAIGLSSRLVVVTGGQERVMSSPYPSRLLWSPRSDRLAVVGFGRGLIVDPDGGRRLELEATDVGWTPDARELLYADGREVFSVPAEGGAPRSISRAAAFALSPSGDRLALVRPNDEDSDCMEDQPVILDRATGSEPVIGSCWIEGSSRGDRLRGRNARDEIDGFSGGDRIEARGGDDVVRGWDGRDALHGGLGRDRLSGGPGSDRLFGRDGVEDLVDCGTGRDRAVVDATDVVASNCERVLRR